jgi:hypothetical protein
MLHLQEIVCRPLDVVADLVAVSRTTKESLQISMSRVPCKTAVRCCVCFTMEGSRPSMRCDGRHSTLSCQAPRLRLFVK